MMNTMEQVHEGFDNWNNEEEREELHDILIRHSNSIDSVSFGSSIAITNHSIVRKLIQIKNPKYRQYNVKFKIFRKDILFKTFGDILPLRNSIYELRGRVDYEGYFNLNICFRFR